MDVNFFYENYMEALKHAAGDGALIALGGISLIYILIFMPRARRIAIAVMIMALFLSNPLTGSLALYVTETSQPYSRFFWLMFPELLCAIAACHLVISRRSLPFRYLMLLACTALILSSGHLLLSTEFFDKPENEYKISQTAIDVGEYLQAKQEKENKGGAVFAKKKADRSERSRAVVADELCYDIRQIRSGLYLRYGRHGIRLVNRIESRLVSSSDEEATKKYFEKLEREHVSAIVLRTNEDIRLVMEHYGWVREDEVSGYTIYVPK